MSPAKKPQRKQPRRPATAAPRRAIPVGKAEPAGGDFPARLRRRFGRAFVLNLISAPGSGKTELVVQTSLRLKDRFRIGAIAGDVQTGLDAERIARAGIAARAIETHGGCHLTAEQVYAAAAE